MKSSSFFCCLVVASTFFFHTRTADAQYAPTALAPSTAGGGLTCLHVTTCMARPSCSTCATVTNGAGMTSVPLCLPDIRAQIYCCDGPADCPVFAGAATPTCRMVTGVSGIGGICNYMDPVCTDGGGVMSAGFAQILQCFTASPDACDPMSSVSPGIVPWTEGDCDMDGVPNGAEDDAAVCVAMAPMCDAGVPDLGVSDLGAASDLGTNGDLGVDSGASPPGDMGAGIDGGGGVDGGGSSLDSGANGTSFRGSGGCNCRVSDGASPGAGPHGALAAGFVVLGLVLRRRLRGRAR